ncbi:histidine kinase [Catenulispora acidiphila DSM 44928]|uniref:Oxygen sensor histidine kinase NreB n=1 Tax=Catenulispora acidiphila (strain DSM 44928 / JCM 14897 / NBRC 102108 / NRRL B-24433 / ID139908) TaxID=479433 RepID=C7Q8I4_CATAD|nr:sensor histidine kinase [Catenulispora acidiphila]ACU76172.1 histidine kinase [Catenulispora acidiphila DSM 44928]
MIQPATAVGPEGRAAVPASAVAAAPVAAAPVQDARSDARHDARSAEPHAGAGADTPVSDTIAQDARASFQSWKRIARWWAVGWHFGLAISVVLVAVEHKPVWLYGALAGMSLSYLLLQHRWLLDRGNPRAVYYHLAIVCTLCFAMVWADLSLIYMSSVVLSQFAPLAGFRARGIAILAAAAAVLTFPIAASDGFTSGDLVAWGLTAVGALLFNLFIGLFFGEMLNDHDRRGALIRELEATRAELERAHHEAGVREERERLAREIHDTLAQGFTSLLMLVQAAEATLDTDPATTRERLDLAARTARENLAEARALIGGDPTAGLPLDAALQRAAARIGEELGMATSVDIGGSARTLTATVQVVTLRVAQEALANVRKHARAASVTVWLTYGADRLTLAVEDDGVGMPEAPCGGFGMRSMRERVEQVGGELTITSAPGAGTRVEAEVPYE